MNATAFETRIMDIYYQIDMMNCDLLPAESKIKGNTAHIAKVIFGRKRRNGNTKVCIQHKRI